MKPQGKPFDNPVESCGIDLQMFQDLLNESISLSEKNVIEKHIETCFHCQQLLDQLKSVTPESTLSFFSDSSAVDPDTDILPFPVEICSGISTNNHWPLMESLRKLARNTLDNITDLLTMSNLDTIPIPATSAVRNPHQLVQMDIINLTPKTLAENDLRPEIMEGTWTINGFSSAFENGSAYLMVMPISQLSIRLPGWNRQDSQAMLHTFLESGGSPETLTGIAVLEGIFLPSKSDLCLSFQVSPELNRLIQAVDRMATAIVIV